MWIILRLLLNLLQYFFCLMFWFFGCKACEILGFPGGSVVKNPTAIQEIWVQSLGWDDSLEKEMATHSSILAWRIPWTEEPGKLQLMGSQRVGHD